MWRIETRTGTGPAERLVRFGRHQIPVSEIVGLHLEEVRESVAAGLFLTANMFLICAAMLAYYVFEVGARERFLIGTFFLGGLGVAALGEALRLRGVRHYEITFHLRDGRTILFSSTDRADIQALALRVAAEGAPLR